MVWTGSWSEADARHAMENSANIGYDLIELALIDPDIFDVPMTSRLLAEYGLKATGSLGLDDATDVSSEDPDIVAAGRARLAKALNIVRDTGGSILCGVIFGKLGKYNGPATERGRANSEETIAWLADKAAESDIKLGLEFCNRYETNIINTTAETLAMIERVGRDNVVAHLDTYHMNIEEHSFTEAIQAASAAGKLGYVHIGESHRGYLGTGSINWTEFFGALRGVNYDGIVTFESFSSRVLHPTLSNSLAIWRNLWDDNVDLATKALAFAKAGLEG
ncbi:TIM barrel protein [Nakamurella sp. YIM 132087]|uniref:TIM barrel protein n=2 Tax=Nakamurella alba TaxID=2665158 RepID=A0A7K1FN08_9ACTN|nr:TIM barrel protein [Nakamurella alba]